MKRTLAILVCLAGCVSPVTSPEELYLEAQNAWRNGDREGALESSRRGLEQSEQESAWFWKFRLLEAELLLSPDTDRALELLQHPVEEFPQSRPLELRRKVLLADAWRRKKAPQRAAALFEESRQEAEEAGWETLLAEIAYGNALLLEGLEQEERFRDSIRHAAQGDDPYLEARARWALGYGLLRRNRFDQAIDVMEPGVEAARRAQATALSGNLHTNLGICYSRLGYFETGLSLLEEALHAHESTRSTTGIWSTLLAIGSSHFLQSQGRKAAEFYERAFEHAPDPRKAEPAGYAASAYILAEDWELAEKWNEISRNLSGEDTNPYVDLNAANIAFRKGDLRLADQLLRELRDSGPIPTRLRWRVEGMLGELRAEQRRWRESNRHFERALELIGEDTDALVNEEDRIRYLPQLINFHRGYVHNLVEQNARGKALSVAETSRARVLAKRYGMDHGPGITPTLEQLEEHARRTGTVYLYFWLAQRSSFLWVFSPHGSDFLRLPGEEKLIHLVGLHQRIVEGGRDPLARKYPPSLALSEVLLGDARPLIPPGSRVVIVPDSELYRVSFDTLPLLDPQPHYWLEDVTLSIAPSLRLALAPARARSGEHSLLLIGDPRTGDPDYPDLPDAGREMNSLRGYFSSAEARVLQGLAAHPDAYRASDPQRFSMIHFASHADVNPVSPLDSFIALSPTPGGKSFKLYARDVQEIPLEADLVAISGCRSAGQSVFAGEGLLGLTWAFLYAGAGSVVGGLWDVADDSTAHLMDRFYDHLSRGSRPAEALRQAKLELLRSRGYRKPYYWGPFQLHRGVGTRSRSSSASGGVTAGRR